MSVIHQFRNIAKEPFNPYLRDYKGKGGKIVGIFCSYVPEELVVAAGMVPFRMRAVGSTKTTLGDTWFSSFNCSYARHIFDLALEEKFKFIDGIVFINACDHIRRMYDNWQAALDDPPFIHLIAVPHKKDEGAVQWYREELEIFKKKLEEHFQVAISDEALWEAIRTSNRIRRSLSKIYEMRKNDSPPVTGAEMLSIIMAGTALPKDRFLTMLDALGEELPGRRVYPSNAPRLMIQSGCLEEIEHLELIESHGAALVDDSLCFGRRYFDKEVDETLENPLDALAERYMNHLSCPRISDDFRNRIEYTKNSVKQYRLEGLICERLKFCDLWGGEAFILKNELKKIGLPMLYLERELYAGSEGQLKTRVQAFMERIGKF
ncbi:MAG: 2-hydroxyacyl-CoA dehydratase family protein [Desulfobacterales bacterium]